MADRRTTVTELVTGLGMLGFDDLDAALAARPAEMVSVSPEVWTLLTEMRRGGAHRQEFEAAWQNGRAFLRAPEALRGRVPQRIEWRGSQRAPGDEVVPADLRVDHVYMVSCKYLSRILVNGAPAHVFDRLLAGGHGRRGGDWYEDVAAPSYDRLFGLVRAELGLYDLPERVADIGRDDRRRLRDTLGSGRWPESLRSAAEGFARDVADATATRWRAALSQLPVAAAALWRLLRIGSAPYFVLGASPRGSLRLRIDTPWDWRQRFDLVSFDVDPRPAGQPTVGYSARVRDRMSGGETSVDGHVEVRWSHGKFAQPPEAKVYLDTPHHRVPGYWPLG